MITSAIVVLVGCDLETKQIAKNELKFKENKFYLGNTIQLIYAENSGGMLSLGSDLPPKIRKYVFQFFVGIVLLGILFLTIYKNDLSTFQRISLVLFLSGGIGNLMSRIFYNGKVIDFIVVDIFSFKTGIFNIADVYVILAMFLILYANYLARRSIVKIT